MTRKVSVGGTLTFRIPYGGRAKFDWWLDEFGHDVLVECMSPWKGLSSDLHRIGMGPKFSQAEARRLAEVLARRIIDNLDYAVRNRSKDDIVFASWYDTRQLPLYRKWAWEEAKRRFVEVGLLAGAFKDDDENDDSPENVVSAEHEDRAEDELKRTRIEVIEEFGPLSGAVLLKKWRSA